MVETKMKKLKIILCDDNNYFLEILEGNLTKHLNQKEITYSIQCVSSGEKLLEMNIRDVDVLFLDINLNTQNGMDIAASLRKKDSDFILIFVSELLEYAPRGYEVSALRYVLKKQLEIQLEDTLNAILKYKGYFRNTLEVNFVNGSYSFYVDELVFIESMLHAVYFHFSKSEKRHLYSKLDTVESMFSKDEFVRIHQSYLVNLQYFIDIKNSSAILSDNSILPISQKN